MNIPTYPASHTMTFAAAASSTRLLLIVALLALLAGAAAELLFPPPPSAATLVPSSSTGGREAAGILVDSTAPTPDRAIAPSASEEEGEVTAPRPAAAPATGEGDARIRALATEIARVRRARPVEPAACTAARERLTVHLRDVPGDFAALERVLRSAEFDHATGIDMIDAARDVTTDEAQRCLARLAADPALARRLRSECLERVAFFGGADGDAAGRVGRLLTDATSDPELLPAALAAAGALSRLESGEDGEVTTALLEAESIARAAGRLDEWLAALGESGSSRAVPALRGVSAHALERTRDGAVMALGRIEGEASTAALLERARSDASPLVRLTAVEHLAERPHVAAELDRILAAELDPTVKAGATLARYRSTRPAAPPRTESFEVPVRAR